MKRLALRLAAVLLCAPVWVSTASAEQSAPPPPDINAKGVETTPAATPPEAGSIRPAMPDTRPVRDKASRSRERFAAEIEASSDSVIERKQGTDTVEEYREKGKLRMVRIVPRSGPAQTYFDRNGDGRLDRNELDGPVAPVYFTIYEWN